ncbi:MAG: GNAT family N-acetyltransferase [Eubacteriales bacterium]|nr:GNAT family N-acetyltransferase [Eubacteriales bacterium]
MLRLMTMNDYDGVYALWQGTAGMGLRGADDSREGIARYLLRNPGTSFVAVEQERIVGAILCGHDGRRGMIYHTAVAGDWRGCGIGGALVDAALAALRAQGIRKVALVAFAHNEAGNAFWQARGFRLRKDLFYRDFTLEEQETLPPL